MNRKNQLMLPGELVRSSLYGSAGDRGPRERGGDAGRAEFEGVAPGRAEREAGAGTGLLYPAGSPGGELSTSGKMAAFLGCHASNISRALQKESGSS